ncbi:alpha-glucuronidase family glycosyl hydrolase [uncultured Desulfobulbus sp.]|uniref:alpha-glucuronidase family glycosyl hydrolase n=1 Tax=uncultured Desulfobulbus sp. TaxID=239745 RepID=UPI0029C94550|nr:alpha-glucuronidase family glycosyl hydrolase [uncultured Desulfobulbus sp.]
MRLLFKLPRIFSYAILLCVITILIPNVSTANNISKRNIIVGLKATPKEVYAAKELQRYIYQLTGDLLSIGDEKDMNEAGSFIIGQTGTNTIIKDLADSGTIKISQITLVHEGYILKKLRIWNSDAIIIAGSDETGCLYGVYGLLDDWYGIGFYLGGDVLLGKKISFRLPDVDESKTPSQQIRGFLPWTNFPQSAGVYSFNDYRFIIDQMAKMRMNFLEIHNYNGMGVHNEMFHNFTYNGITSRVYMNSTSTGHGWAGPSWQVKDYLFKGADLFDDYDFGSDCTLHNKSLTNEQVFRKGASLFQQVIEYAHSRGVKIGLGIELDIIPAVYKTKPNNPDVVNARINQIINDYPNLDYLMCYRSEVIAAESQNIWQEIFDQFYKRFKAEAPGTRLTVSGWGLSADHVAHLPADVIAAPIAPYSAAFEDGSIYTLHEYWGCPWLERDFNSSVHYYPYNMNLSDTIKAYTKQAPNMTGFMCLTWRLTDAVDAKMSYIAKAPWDIDNKLDSSRAVYYEYAKKNYGVKSASEITDIINENEPYANNTSECEGTAEFTGKDRSTDIQKAVAQLAVIDDYILKTDDPGMRHRLELLRNRIASVKYWCELDQSFKNAGWDGLPGAFPAWAKTFRDRVTDISSLGNVVSTQNRLVQLRYLAKENELRKQQVVKAPSYVETRGTINGAEITWRNMEPNARSFNVYRDSVKINKSQLSPTHLSFKDTVNGIHSYSVTAISKSGIESAKSVPDICAAGSADAGAPKIVVVSPPMSIASGQSPEIKARILDDRTYGSISASIHYRTPGATQWKSRSMNRRVRSIFAIKIPASEISSEGLEYYITASDGSNTGFYPMTAPYVNAAVIRCDSIRSKIEFSQIQLHASDGNLVWNAVSGDVLWYRIYRSRSKSFTPGPDNLLTWVDKGTHQFRDIEPGFDGEKIHGRYYYRVSAVDRLGHESRPSGCVSLIQPVNPVSKNGAKIYEAESAVLSNVQVYSDPNASDNNAVGYFGEEVGDSILFENLTPSKSMSITYSNGTGKDTRCSLYIDGKDAVTIDFPKTADWYSYEKINISLPVRSSVELRVDADDYEYNKGFCANIDFLELYGP